MADDKKTPQTPAPKAAHKHALEASRIVYCGDCGSPMFWNGAEYVELVVA